MHRSIAIDLYVNRYNRSIASIYCNRYMHQSIAMINTYAYYNRSIHQYIALIDAIDLFWAAGKHVNF